MVAHPHLARIEVAREELPGLLAPAAARAAAAAVRAAGYRRVAVDLAGYRSGSLLATRNLTDSASGREG